jgi:hypothetical protein
VRLTACSERRVMSDRSPLIGTPSRIRCLGVAAVVLFLVSLLTMGCDFQAIISVENRSSVPILVDVNDEGHPGRVDPGQSGEFFTGTNENLRTLRITAATDAADEVVKEFTRKRGYKVKVVVTGPPLEAAVETRSF